ncbi:MULTISPECIES: hypothetical protein [unclassified Micromonospora]|uniref:hypothetical protein n=1 Tax=unclassified Micromonospora TaxID=2617518 RepID=UPI001C5D12BA|nr:hypothetical protein [Micromonospora sp. RL09-050-HVF-A]MBW4700912.1 hypothetical protein [Micromonospora sp. RL09-050-HVF-A]
MTGPPGDQLPLLRAHPLQVPPARALDALRMTVNLKDVDVSLNLPDGPLTSAMIKVEVPDLDPVEISYSVQAGFTEELARISKQYAGPTSLVDPTSLVGPDESAASDPTADTGSAPFDTESDDKRLQDIITGLLRWQQALEVAGALSESADLQSLGKAHHALVESLRVKYVDRMGKLRTELLNQRDAVPILRKWLQSGNDALINLAIRVAGEPALRTAVQDDLARIAGDEGMSPQTRRRARAYLRRWRRREIAGTRPEGAAESPD